MVTFLAGGTGTPKLLFGSGDVFSPEDTPVICNTGDDIELGGHLVCPDLDSVLYSESDRLDRDTWWGLDNDSTTTHATLQSLAEAIGIEPSARYLPSDEQTNGRTISRWRRFSAVGEFMQIGDLDRAVHLTRTGLIDEGHTLTQVTQMLTTALGIQRPILPMSDDPVTTIIHTDSGPMHFQEFWVQHQAEPVIADVEFRDAEIAEPTEAVLAALENPVVIGPSNPVTSIGPMLAIDEIQEALMATPVIVVSPFVEEEVFSGPAGKLLQAVGYEPATAGVASAYPFADAFVLDVDDTTDLDRPVVKTDTSLGTEDDGKRVCQAVNDALSEVT